MKTRLLGFGEISVFQSMLNPEYYERHEIVQVACGFIHTLLLTSTGRVHSLGNDGFGQCGVGTRSEKLTSPTMINDLKNVESIDAGGWFSLFITREKKLYACGRICLTRDFLRMPRSQKAIPLLTEDFAKIDVTKMHGCSDGSFIVQATDWQLYALGDNARGCCGVNEMGLVTRPTKVMKSVDDKISYFDHPVKSIRGGKEFMVILDCDQRLWISGQMMHQKTSHVFYEPFAQRPVVQSKSIVAISTGWELLVLLMANGDVYFVCDEYNFERLAYPVPIQSISCGIGYCWLSGTNNIYYGYRATADQFGSCNTSSHDEDLKIDNDLVTDYGKYQTVSIVAGFDHVIFLQVLMSTTCFVSQLYSRSVHSEFTDITITSFK